MEETVGTLGAQITEVKKESEKVEVVTEEVVEKKDEALVADPTLDKEAPLEVAAVPNADEVVDDNEKTLQEIISEQEDKVEQEKREAELDAKLKKELNVEEAVADVVEQVQEKIDEVKKDIESEPKVETKEDKEAYVEIEKAKKDELPKEAVDALNKIKDLYENKVYKLEAEDKVNKAQIEVLNEKLKEMAQTIAKLESSGANVSNKAIYFDKLLEAGDKGKITDYLIDLLGVYYPSVSKEKLLEVTTAKKSFATTVKADSIHEKLTSKTSQLDQIRSAYKGVYKATKQ